MTNRFIHGVICFFLLQVSPLSTALAETVFTIGNSLTWDTSPPNLDNSQWHIFCNKNLRFIADNPTGHCINTSVLWTDALANQQFDYVTVQPFSGTTLQDDVSVISQWMAMQPDAQFVLHTGWGSSATHGMQWHSQPSNLSVFSPTAAYFDTLESAIEQQTGREVHQTAAGDVLASIAADIANGSSPFDSLGDLYRDSIHMNSEGGYLMRNLMRLGVNQELMLDTSSQVSSERAYLNQKIVAVAVAVPEPRAVSLISFAIVTVLIGRRVRNRKLDAKT